MRTATKHHVLSVTGRTLATKIAGLERHIDKACSHWAGTADEFRAWALKAMQHGMANILDRASCDTPDNAIGV